MNIIIVYAFNLCNKYCTNSYSSNPALIMGLEKIKGLKVVIRAYLAISNIKFLELSFTTPSSTSMSLCKTSNNFVHG